MNAKDLVVGRRGWATGSPDAKIRYMDVVDRAVRCPDPFLALSGGWLLRRLAPHCSRIEFGQYPKSRDEARLLHAMGRETANVHFGTPKSFLENVALEYERNGERYQFLRWGQSAFRNFRVVPPGTGICHQVNLEYLGQSVWTTDAGEAYPDTVVGTVLTQTLRELRSLEPGAVTTTVIGPIRVAA